MEKLTIGELQKQRIRTSADHLVELTLSGLQTRNADNGLSRDVRFRQMLSDHYLNEIMIAHLLESGENIENISEHLVDTTQHTFVAQTHEEGPFKDWMKKCYSNELRTLVYQDSQYRKA
jgi:hypothetical protein